MNELTQDFGWVHFVGQAARKPSVEVSEMEPLDYHYSACMVPDSPPPLEPASPERYESDCIPLEPASSGGYESDCIPLPTREGIFEDTRTENAIDKNEPEIQVREQDLEFMCKKCPVCKIKIVRDMMLGTCGHVYHSKCIEKLPKLERNRKGTKVCLECEEQCRFGKLFFEPCAVLRGLLHIYDGGDEPEKARGEIVRRELAKVEAKRQKYVLERDDRKRLLDEKFAQIELELARSKSLKDNSKLSDLIKSETKKLYKHDERMYDLQQSLNTLLTSNDCHPLLPTLHKCVKMEELRRNIVDLGSEVEPQRKGDMSQVLYYLKELQTMKKEREEFARKSEDELKSLKTETKINQEHIFKQRQKYKDMSLKLHRLQKDLQIAQKKESELAAALGSISIKNQQARRGALSASVPPPPSVIPYEAKELPVPGGIILPLKRGKSMSSRLGPRLPTSSLPAKRVVQPTAPPSPGLAMNTKSVASIRLFGNTHGASGGQFIRTEPSKRGFISNKNSFFQKAFNSLDHLDAARPAALENFDRFSLSDITNLSNECPTKAQLKVKTVFSTSRFPRPQSALHSHFKIHKDHQESIQTTSARQDTHPITPHGSSQVSSHQQTTTKASSINPDPPKGCRSRSALSDDDEMGESGEEELEDKEGMCRTKDEEDDKEWDDQEGQDLWSIGGEVDDENIRKGWQVLGEHAGQTGRQNGTAGRKGNNTESCGVSVMDRHRMGVHQLVSIGAHTQAGAAQDQLGGRCTEKSTLNNLQHPTKTTTPSSSLGAHTGSSSGTNVFRRKRPASFKSKKKTKKAAPNGSVPRISSFFRPTNSIVN